MQAEPPKSTAGSGKSSPVLLWAPRGWIRSFSFLGHRRVEAERFLRQDHAGSEATGTDPAAPWPARGRTGTEPRSEEGRPGAEARRDGGCYRPGPSSPSPNPLPHGPSRPCAALRPTGVCPRFCAGAHGAQEGALCPRKAAAVKPRSPTAGSGPRHSAGRARERPRAQHPRRPRFPQQRVSTWLLAPVSDRTGGHRRSQRDFKLKSDKEACPALPLSLRRFGARARPARTPRGQHLPPTPRASRRANPEFLPIHRARISLV